MLQNHILRLSPSEATDEYTFLWPLIHRQFLSTLPASDVYRLIALSGPFQGRWFYWDPVILRLLRRTSYEFQLLLSAGLLWKFHVRTKSTTFSIILSIYQWYSIIYGWFCTIRINSVFSWDTKVFAPFPTAKKGGKKARNVRQGKVRYEPRILGYWAKWYGQLC